VDGLQKAWSIIVKGFLGNLAELWATFVRGVLHDWNISVFIFGMAAVLLTGLFTMWKKKI
jgi:hypothetical protein